MLTVIAVIHLIVAIALILIVLLQTGRGSEIGAAFGGGSSQTLFGSSGSSRFYDETDNSCCCYFYVDELVSGLFLWTQREFSKENGSCSVRRKCTGEEQRADTCAEMIAEVVELADTPS